MPTYHCPKCQFVTVNVCSGVSPSIFKDMAEISLDEISSTEWTEDEKCKTNSQSSDSSSDTLVEEKSDERRVQAREMSTQTVVKRTRTRTRRQKREASLRRQEREMAPSIRPPPRVRASSFRPPPRVEEIPRREHSISSWQSPSRHHRSRYHSYSSRHRRESSQRSGHNVSSSAVQVSNRFSRRRNHSRSLSNGNDSKKPAVSFAVSDKGSSVEFQGRDYNPGDSRRSTCPIPGCGTLTRKLKHHAYKKHLPGIMRDTPHEKGERD